MGLSGVVVAVVKLVTDVIAVGCCVLRWYILRKKKSAGTQWSHVLFTSAVLCEVAATVLSTMVLLDADAYIAKHGLAVGQLYLLNETVLKTTFWAHFLYYLAECVLKAAYLAFYTDLYARVHTRRRLAIWIAGGVWAASYLTAFLVMFTYCAPLSQNWRPDGTQPHCPVLFNVPTFFILSGANILSDAAILVVPLLIIGGMKLGRTEKLSLVLVFSIGMISIAASVLRAGLVGHEFVTANHTWATVWQWMLWSHAEIFFGVLAFTLPAFRHVLLRGIKKISSTSGKSTGDSKGYGGNISRLQKESRGVERLGSRDTGRGGVLVETTVTLREESTEDFHPGDSDTELGVFDNGMKKKGYGWRIDGPSAGAER